MELRNEDRIPSSAVDQLRRLCRLLTESLPSLQGVILHGSAATSGFEPDRSDLDVFAIVEVDPDFRQVARVGSGILAISNTPHPLEFSLIARRDLVNWHAPCRHLMHFGEENRGRYQRGACVPLSPTDDDLTMHMVVARSRGIDLLGEFPVTRLPRVSRTEFLAAVLSDFEWALNRDEDLSRYILSNACRTLAFLRDGVVLSKSEGRQWCDERGIDLANIVAEVMDALRGEIAA